MDKLYNLGVVCGRFGHIHIGHTNLIEHSLLLCRKTLVLVGSAQESRTLRNPFGIDTRIGLIEQTYPEIVGKDLLIKPLTDTTNEYDITYAWGAHVKKTIESYTGCFADLLINGNDKSRQGWFDPKDLEDTTELIVSRNKIPVSATKTRGMLVIDDRENWEKSTPSQIHNMYNSLRDELLSIPVYKEIYNKVCKENLSIDVFNRVYKDYERLDKEEKIKGLG